MPDIKLPAANIVELKQRQRELHDILAEFDKLDECGVDCQALRAAHEEAANKIAAMLKNYGQG